MSAQRSTRCRRGSPAHKRPRFGYEQKLHRHRSQSNGDCCYCSPVSTAMARNNSPFAWQWPRCSWTKSHSESFRLHSNINLRYNWTEQTWHARQPNSSAALYLSGKIRLFRCLVYELNDLLPAILSYLHLNSSILRRYWYWFQLFRWKPTTSNRKHSLHSTN